MIVIECASNERHQSQTVAHSTTGEEILSKMKIILYHSEEQTGVLSGVIFVYSAAVLRISPDDPTKNQ